MALKTTYTKADLRELVFYYADHSSAHYNYGGTPLSDHPLVNGTQGRNYNYTAWMGNNQARTIFQYRTTQLVLADNSTTPTIRTISPVDFGVSSGNPPAEWTGTSNIIPDYPNSSSNQQPVTLTSSHYMGGGNTYYRLQYAKPSNFTMVIKKMFTTPNIFSQPHDTVLGNTIFNSSYATNLLNSVQKLVNGPDFVNYNLERLGGTGRSNGNWAEGYFTMMPVIDNIIEQYASTVNKNKMEIYFNLFKRVDLEKVNILVYFITSENYYNATQYYSSDPVWPDNRYSLYYVTEIDKISNAMNKLDWYKSQHLKNYLKSLNTYLNEKFNKLKQDLNHSVIYSKGIQSYNTAKSVITSIR